jgi:RimJ/RimL family protein N-acetyltransferase
MSSRKNAESGPPHLHDHGVRLSDGLIVLRPLSEEDWPVLLRWNNDPEVLFFTEGDDVAGRSIEEVQGIWRSVATSAHCFMIEYEGTPVGECWLQRMNIERLVHAFSGKDCRRIDLCIGEKGVWNQGIGARTIRLLTAFGFEEEQADAIFGLVGGHNPRSRRAFEKAGFELLGVVQEPGPKSDVSWDLVLFREGWQPSPAT